MNSPIVSLLWSNPICSSNAKFIEIDKWVDRDRDITIWLLSALGLTTTSSMKDLITWMKCKIHVLSSIPAIVKLQIYMISTFFLILAYGHTRNQINFPNRHRHRQAGNQDTQCYICGQLDRGVNAEIRKKIINTRFFSYWNNISWSLNQSVQWNRPTKTFRIYSDKTMFVDLSMGSYCKY